MKIPRRNHTRMLCTPLRGLYSDRVYCSLNIRGTKEPVACDDCKERYPLYPLLTSLMTGWLAGRGLYHLSLTHTQSVGGLWRNFKPLRALYSFSCNISLRAYIAISRQNIAIRQFIYKIFMAHRGPIKCLNWAIAAAAAAAV